MTLDEKYFFPTELSRGSHPAENTQDIKRGVMFMPIYEYRCVGCGLEFTVQRPMSECDANAECPECGQAGKRLFSSEFVVVMKGVGYEWCPNPAGASKPPVREKDEERLDNRSRAMDRWAGIR